MNTHNAARSDFFRIIAFFPSCLFLLFDSGSGRHILRPLPAARFRRDSGAVEFSRNRRIQEQCFGQLPMPGGDHWYYPLQAAVTYLPGVPRDHVGGTDHGMADPSNPVARSSRELALDRGPGPLLSGSLPIPEFRYLAAHGHAPGHPPFVLSSLVGQAVIGEIGSISRVSAAGMIQSTTVGQPFLIGPVEIDGSGPS